MFGGGVPILQRSPESLAGLRGNGGRGKAGLNENIATLRLYIGCYRIPKRGTTISVVDKRVGGR